LEEVMEVDPPVTDLSGEDDSTDSEYTDVDDGGAMMLEDLEDERENMAPPPPPVIRSLTPFPAPVLQELILIKDPTPLYPGVELEGEDDVWYKILGRIRWQVSIGTTCLWMGLRMRCGHPLGLSTGRLSR
jgi:hypothetical protein